MKLDFNIQLNQKQGLALTAQVQQAIKLLHMTNLEIQEFVSEQFQDNPFIETNDFSESRDQQASRSAKSTDVDKSFEDNLQKGLVTVYPDVTFKRIECMDMDTMLMVQMDIMKRRKNPI